MQKTTIQMLCDVDSYDGDPFVSDCVFAQKNMGVEAIALYIIATCIIWKLAPVQDKNKPLDLDEQKKYRKRVHSLLIIISCISGCLYFWGIYVVPAVVVCVVCQLSIVLIWGKLKNHAHGCTSTV